MGKKKSSTSTNKSTTKPNICHRPSSSWVDQIRWIPFVQEIELHDENTANKNDKEKKNSIETTNASVHARTTLHSSTTASISIISWNILAKSLCTKDSQRNLPQQYQNHVFDPSRRSHRISSILQHLFVQSCNVDVICLQEVDTNEIRTVLETKGYKGIETPRTTVSKKQKTNNAKRGDSCAIYVRTSSCWTIQNHEIVDLDDLATKSTTSFVKESAATVANLNYDPNHTNNTNTIGSQTSDKPHGIQKPFLRRNVALLVRLQHKTNPKMTIVIANTHLFWNPSFEYVKLCQAHYILQRAKSFCLYEKEPLILCGDFNSRPNGIVQTYLSRGTINAKLQSPWYATATTTTTTTTTTSSDNCFSQSTHTNSHVYDSHDSKPDQANNIYIDLSNENSSNSNNEKRCTDEASSTICFNRPLRMRYLLDATLKKLCWWLRILGQDVYLETEQEEQKRTIEWNMILFKRCHNEKRTLVTASDKILNRSDCPASVYCMSPQLVQYQQVALVHMLLTHKVVLDPSTFLRRCIVCNNDSLIEVRSMYEKKRILLSKHQHGIIKNRKKIERMSVYRCYGCKQIYYWRSGSYVQKTASKLFELCLSAGVPCCYRNKNDNVTIGKNRDGKDMFQHLDEAKLRSRGWDFSIPGSDLLRRQLDVVEWMNSEQLQCPYRFVSAYNVTNNDNHSIISTKAGTADIYKTKTNRASISSGDDGYIIKERLPFTNVTNDFVDTLDYIFFTKNNNNSNDCRENSYHYSLNLIETLSVPASLQELNRNDIPQGHLLPSDVWPSDHLAIGAKFVLILDESITDDCITVLEMIEPLPVIAFSVFITILYFLGFVLDALVLTMCSNFEQDDGTTTIQSTDILEQQGNVIIVGEDVDSEKNLDQNNLTNSRSNVHIRPTLAIGGTAAARNNHANAVVDKSSQQFPINDILQLLNQNEIDAASELFQRLQQKQLTNNDREEILHYAKLSLDSDCIEIAFPGLLKPISEKSEICVVDGLEAKLEDIGEHSQNDSKQSNEVDETCFSMQKYSQIGTHGSCTRDVLQDCMSPTNGGKVNGKRVVAMKSHGGCTEDAIVQEQSAVERMAPTAQQETDRDTMTMMAKVETVDSEQEQDSQTSILSTESEPHALETETVSGMWLKAIVDATACLRIETLTTTSSSRIYNNKKNSNRNHHNSNDDDDDVLQIQKQTLEHSLQYLERLQRILEEECGNTTSLSDAADNSTRMMIWGPFWDEPPCSNPPPFHDTTWRGTTSTSNSQFGNCGGMNTSTINNSNNNYAIRPSQVNMQNIDDTTISTSSSNGSIHRNGMHTTSTIMDRRRILIRIITSQSEIDSCLGTTVYIKSKKWYDGATQFSFALKKIHCALNVADTHITKLLSLLDSSNNNSDYSKLSVYCEDASVAEIAIVGLTNNKEKYVKLANERLEYLKQKLRKRELLKKKVGIERWKNNPRPKFDFAIELMECEEEIREIEKSIQYLNTNIELQLRTVVENTNSMKQKLNGCQKKNSYVIQFKKSQCNFTVAPGLGVQDLEIGTYVKVEAKNQGEDLGIVVGKAAVANKQKRKRIMRLATNDEISLLSRQREEEDDCVKMCHNKVVELGLPMKVVDAEYRFDRHKLTFYFTATSRVDFRELVRDLNRIYKTRIWMDQLDKEITFNTSTN